LRRFDAQSDPTPVHTENRHGDGVSDEERLTDFATQNEPASGSSSIRRLFRGRESGKFLPEDPNGRVAEANPYPSGSYLHDLDLDVSDLETLTLQP